MGYTEGPWDIYAPDGSFSAPDLLQACIDACQFYQDNFDIMPVAWQTIDNILTSAIARATGEED